MLWMPQLSVSWCPEVWSQWTPTSNVQDSIPYGDAHSHSLDTSDHMNSSTGQIRYQDYCTRGTSEQSPFCWLAREDCKAVVGPNMAVCTEWVVMQRQQQVQWGIVLRGVYLFWHRIDSTIHYTDVIATFFVQETLPSVVTFRYSQLNVGTHIVRIRAIAATAGNFTLPPTSAFVNSQPEVMGLSAVGELEVCSGDGCSAREKAPQVTPMECPENCSNNGLCNLEVGQCLCFEGFTGEDCSAFSDT